MQSKLGYPAIRCTQVQQVDSDGHCLIAPAGVNDIFEYAVNDAQLAEIGTERMALLGKGRLDQLQTKVFVSNIGDPTLQRVNRLGIEIEVAQKPVE